MHVVCDEICTFVEINTQNRAAERLHGQPAAFDVEVDIAAVAPAIDECLCGPGYVAAVIADIVFREDRLQRALARSPRLVGQDEQAVPRHMPHFLVNDASFREGVIAPQHVADPIG